MLLRLSDMKLPCDLHMLFGRAAPLILDAGCGDGQFITGLAALHPEWNLLGAEVSGASVVRARRRLLRNPRPHARLFLGRAEFVVRAVLPPHSVRRVYVNFPDPWPKKRHLEKRLLQAQFFRLLSTRLEDGGDVLVTTDHAAYLAFALSQARGTGLFSSDQCAPPEEVLETKYARKWRDHDKQILHARLAKIGEAPGVFKPPERFEMPHAFLAGDVPALDSFAKQVHGWPGGTVVLLKAYYGVGGSELLFLVQVEEADLRQHVLVSARPHRRGVFVGLERFGDVLVTRGVKEAVKAVAAWLETQGLALLEAAY